MLKVAFLPLVGLFLFSLVSLPLKASSLADDVNLRIQTFDDIDRVFKALRFKVVNMRSQDAAGAMTYSEELVGLAYRLPGLFEEESPRELFPQSNSRPQIWSRKDRYDFLMNQFIDRLEKTHELLEQGNMSEAGRMIDRTAQGCRQCHNTFRYR